MKMKWINIPLHLHHGLHRKQNLLAAASHYEHWNGWWHPMHTHYEHGHQTAECRNLSATAVLHMSTEESLFLVHLQKQNIQQLLFLFVSFLSQYYISQTVQPQHCCNQRRLLCDKVLNEFHVPHILKIHLNLMLQWPSLSLKSQFSKMHPITSLPSPYTYIMQGNPCGVGHRTENCGIKKNWVQMYLGNTKKLV